MVIYQMNCAKTDEYIYSFIENYKWDEELLTNKCNFSSSRCDRYEYVSLGWLRSWTTSHTVGMETFLMTGGEKRTMSQKLKIEMYYNYHLMLELLF